MSRIQLALNVSDLEASIAHYAALFDTPPHKVREGYANFAIAEPPLKLVLIESSAADAGSLNHLGVEVESADAVAASVTRLEAAGLATDVRDSELCCHAVMDKVWANAPDGERWEIYTILDDQPTVDLPRDQMLDGLPVASAATACC